MPSTYGGYGVWLFLVISGFLIHLGYLRSNTFEPIKFFNKRFWRIYPPYLLAFLIFALYKGSEWTNTILHLTLTYNLSDNHIYETNASFWSLAMEFQLYMIYPLFLWLRKQAGKHIYWLLLVLHVVLLLDPFNIGGHAYNQSVLVYWGIWASGAYLAEKFHAKERIANTTGNHIFLLFILYTLTKFVAIPFSTLLLFGFFILFMDWFLNTEFEVWPVLFKSVSYIRLISYSIYLFHQPFLKDMIIFFSFQWQNFPLVLMAVGISFLLIVGVSALSQHFIEIPAIKLGADFYKKYLERKEIKEIVA